MAKYYDYKVTLKTTTYLTLSDADFESLGCTFLTATERDIKAAIDAHLKDIAEYDEFDAEYEGEEEV